MKWSSKRFSNLFFSLFASSSSYVEHPQFYIPELFFFTFDKTKKNFTKSLALHLNDLKICENDFIINFTSARIFPFYFCSPQRIFFFIRSSAVCRCESRAPKKCIVWKIEVIRQVFYVIVAQKFLLVVKGKQIFSPFEKVLWNSKAKSSERNDGCKVKVRCVM